MATPGNPERAFETAKRKFISESELSPSELSELKKTTSKDHLLRTLAIIQDEQKKSKTQRCLRRIQSFINALNQYSDILNIFVNANEMVAYVWGPVKFLLVHVSAHLETFERLLEGYHIIGENMPQIHQVDELFKTNPQMQSIMVMIFEDLLEFHADAIRIVRQKAWKTVFKAVFNKTSAKIKHIGERFGQHKLLLQSQVTISTYQETIVIRRKLESCEEDRIHAQRDRLYTWLDGVKSGIRQDDLMRHRHGKSGSWLFKNEDFNRWFDLDLCADPLLWMTGAPGAGKSVLASTIVQAIQQMKGANVSFYYCQQGDDHARGLLTIAKAMLLQVLAQGNDLLDYLYTKRLDDNNPILQSLDLAKELLKTALEHCKRRYIVIDGLDEFASRDSRQAIVQWFTKLVNDNSQKDLCAVRCLFVSQDDGAARKDFTDLTAIKITAKENRDDIEKYCQHWHGEIIKKFAGERLPEGLQNIARLVAARAKGMFLFAKLVCENLHDQVALEDLEEELDPARLPEGLDDAYTCVMNRILGITRSNRNQTMADFTRRPAQRALMLLSWLTCAKRPLRWYEIQCAMQLDPRSGDLKSGRKVNHCKDIGSSLVEINSEQTVTLVHSTTRTYLMQQKDDMGNPRYVNVPQTEASLATICLRHLSHRCFQNNRPEEEVIKDIVNGHYAFSDYAICFWPVHLETGVRQSDKLKPDTLKTLTQTFQTFLGSQLNAVAKPSKVKISDTLRRNLQLFQSEPWFESGCRAVAFVTNLLRPSGKGPQTDDFLVTMHSNIAIRRILEDLAEQRRLVPADSTNPQNPASGEQASKQFADLRTLYGSHLYKCERLNCNFFFRGFDSKTHRQQHIEKHKRTYVCDVEGCPLLIIGCTTAKALAKHKAKDHGEGNLPQANPAVGRSTHKPTQNPVDAREEDQDYLDEDNGSDDGEQDEQDDDEDESNDQEGESEDVTEDHAEGDTLQELGSDLDATQTTELKGDSQISDTQNGIPEVITEDGPEDASQTQEIDSTTEPGIDSASEAPNDQDSQPTTSGSSISPAKPKRTVCHICHKELSRASNMKAHLATHTETRSYGCSTCGKSFRRPHDKVRHERTHGNDRPFLCEGRHVDGTLWGCRRRFARQDALRTHWKTHGSECMTTFHEEVGGGEAETPLLQSQILEEADSVGPPSFFSENRSWNSGHAFSARSQPRALPPPLPTAQYTGYNSDFNLPLFPTHTAQNSFRDSSTPYQSQQVLPGHGIPPTDSELSLDSALHYSLPPIAPSTASQEHLEIPQSSHSMAYGFGHSEPSAVNGVESRAADDSELTLNLWG